IDIFSPEPDCPILAVPWYEAARYCNWLSENEGLPKEEWCYEPNQAGQYADGMTLAPNWEQRTGYRLPSEQEWEYACRAGTVSSRYFGSSDDWVAKFAWYSKNSQNRTWPVGRLKPNDFGLFDMQGNALCWCQDAFGPYELENGAKSKANVSQ